jgi:hypothetical protein
MVEAKGPTLTYEAFHAALSGSSSGSSVKDLVWRIMRTLPCIRLLGEIETLSQLAQGWTQGEFKFNSEFRQLIALKLLASSLGLLHGKIARIFQRLKMSFCLDSIVLHLFVLASRVLLSSCCDSTKLLNFKKNRDAECTPKLNIAYWYFFALTPSPVVNQFYTFDSLLVINTPYATPSTTRQLNEKGLAR